MRADLEATRGETALGAKAATDVAKRAQNAIENFMLFKREREYCFNCAAFVSIQDASVLLHSLRRVLRFEVVLRLPTD